MNGMIKNLDIDSTYRNRMTFPLSSDFDIPMYFGVNNNNIVNASDPVSLQFPSVTNTSFGAYPGLTNVATLNTTSMPYSSTYNNLYLENDCNSFAPSHSYSKIISYNNYLATLDTPIIPTNNYNLRRNIPLLRDQLLVGAVSTTQIQLGALASPAPDAYVNKYIRFFSGLAAGQYARIVSYNHITRVVTLIPKLTAVPNVGSGYEILDFTKDNFSPLSYNGTTTTNNAICYSIELTNLILPNIEILNGSAGFCDDYPYYLVKLYNLNSRHQQPASITNNPNAKDCLFKMPMHVYLKDENYFTLDKCKQIQQITFKPDDSLHFSVCLPNGEPIQYKYPDYISPSDPNPFLQISASFLLKSVK